MVGTFILSFETLTIAAAATSHHRRQLEPDEHVPEATEGFSTHILFRRRRGFVAEPFRVVQHRRRSNHRQREV